MPDQVTKITIAMENGCPSITYEGDAQNILSLLRVALGHPCGQLLRWAFADVIQNRLDEIDRNAPK